MLVAVTDMNIDATTGADLNHFGPNILKSNFIAFIQMQMYQPYKHQLIEVVQEDSRERLVSQQWFC